MAAAPCTASIAGVLLIGVISSAMRLEGYTVNVINIVIGVLLVLSVISTSFLAWVSALTSGGGAEPASQGLVRAGAGKRSPTRVAPTKGETP